MVGKRVRFFDGSLSTGEGSFPLFFFFSFFSSPLLFPLLLLLLFSLLTTAKRRTSHEINEHEEEETEVSFSNLAKWKARGIQLCVII